MEKLNLAETLQIATEIEAAAQGMVERCSGYQDSARVLRRELEYLMQLHHQDPGIFSSNADIHRCAVDFFSTSAQIAKDAETVQSLGLDSAEENLRLVRKQLAHPEHCKYPDMVNQIDTLLKSCEHNIQLARGYVKQLNTYVQYHVRVLKTIKLD